MHNKEQMWLMDVMKTRTHAIYLVYNEDLWCKHFGKQMNSGHNIEIRRLHNANDPETILRLIEEYMLISVLVIITRLNPSHFNLT